MSTTILRDCSKNIPYLVADSSVSPTGLKWAAPAGGNTFVGVSAFNAGAITLTTGVTTAITWSSENFDTDAIHSTATNTNRFTIPSGKGGYWAFMFQVKWASNSSNSRYLFVSKNGTDWLQQEMTATNGNFNQTITGIIDASATDYISCAALQTSGGNLDISAGDYQKAQFWYLGA